MVYRHNSRQGNNPNRTRSDCPRCSIQRSAADPVLAGRTVAAETILNQSLHSVILLRRYWAAGLILLMVAVHAVVIGYVRSRVARLSNPVSNVVEIGQFRFQSVSDLDQVYLFRLHAMVDPSCRQRGREKLLQKRWEILEDCEQLLRQVDPVWLSDPAQAQIRDRLMKVVLEHLDEPMVQRVLITDWLQLPIQTVAPATPTQIARN